MIDLQEKPKTFYFPNRESAELFKGLAMRARRNGRPTLRKTLAGRAYGKTYITDSNHVDGYSVKVCAFAMPDAIEIAQYAKDCGAIDAPNA